LVDSLGGLLEDDKDGLLLAEKAFTVDCASHEVLSPNEIELFRVNQFFDLVTVPRLLSFDPKIASHGGDEIATYLEHAMTIIYGFLGHMLQQEDSRCCDNIESTQATLWQFVLSHAEERLVHILVDSCVFQISHESL